MQIQHVTKCRHCVYSAITCCNTAEKRMSSLDAAWLYHGTDAVLYLIQNGSAGDAPARVGYSVWHLRVQRFGPGGSFDILFNDRCHERKLLPRGPGTTIFDREHRGHQHIARHTCQLEKYLAKHSFLVGGILIAQMDRTYQPRSWGGPVLRIGFCRTCAMAKRKICLARDIRHISCAQPGCADLLRSGILVD